MWTITQTDEFEHLARQLEPNVHRFKERFEGMAFILQRDPVLFSTPLWEDDPSRRIMRSRDFMDGFEVVVGLELDRVLEVVELQWIDRVFVAEPDDDD